MTKKPFLTNQEYINWKEKDLCPICQHKLIKKYEGFVCINFKCPLYFKLGKGWVKLDGSKKNNIIYFKEKYDFNLENFENKKKWLKLKSIILTENDNKCEICGSKIELHVHHIIPRSEMPNLSLDKENLMVLCSKCHKEIHKDDKYKFS